MTIKVELVASPEKPKSIGLVCKCGVAVASGVDGYAVLRCDGCGRVWTLSTMQVRGPRE